MGVRMKHHYTFQSELESQGNESPWSTSPINVNRNSKEISGILSQINQRIIIWSNRLEPLHPVSSTPIGVN